MAPVARVCDMLFVLIKVVLVVPKLPVPPAQTFPATPSPALAPDKTRAPVDAEVDATAAGIVTTPVVPTIEIAGLENVVALAPAAVDGVISKVPLAV